MENRKWNRPKGAHCFRSNMVLGALMLLPMLTFAQGVDMAETMRSDGKIYVVVGVIAIIFLGLAFYLIALDRRISKMENRKGGN